MYASALSGFSSIAFLNAASASVYCCLASATRRCCSSSRAGRHLGDHFVELRDRLVVAAGLHRFDGRTRAGLDGGCRFLVGRAHARRGAQREVQRIVRALTHVGVLRLRADLVLRRRHLVAARRQTDLQELAVLVGLRLASCGSRPPPRRRPWRPAPACLARPSPCRGRRSGRAPALRHRTQHCNCHDAAEQIGPHRKPPQSIPRRLTPPLYKSVC